MDVCPSLHELRFVPSTDPHRGASALIEATEGFLHRNCARLLEDFLFRGGAVSSFTARDVSLLSAAFRDGRVPSAGTLEDFLQVAPLGDKRTLGLLISIDKLVDRVPRFADRIEMLNKAKRRAHLLFPSEPAKIQALQAVIHAEMCLLDDHVVSCQQCLLLHRWRSWAHSFVLLLPSHVAPESVDASALVTHALLSMLGDDSMDCDKDKEEGTTTFFTRLFSEKGDTSGVPSGDGHAVVKALGGLLSYVESVVSQIKPFDPDAARKASTVTDNPGVDAAEALPAQLEAVLGARSFAEVNAVSFRAMLRLAIVLLGKVAKHIGADSATEAWRTWFPASSASEGADADLSDVLSLPLDMLVSADAEAMKSAMAAPSMATESAVLKVILTASDDELGETPSAMTLLWMAATAPE